MQVVGAVCWGKAGPRLWQSTGVLGGASGETSSAAGKGFTQDGISKITVALWPRNRLVRRPKDT